MTSRLVVNSVRHTGASADGITLDASGNVTFPANATCSGTATGFGGGKLLQVVQAVKTDHASDSNISTFTDLTGLTLDITPASSSNKILISVFLQCGDDGNGYTGFRLLRGSTNIGHSTALDGESSDNTQDSAFFYGTEQSQGTYKTGVAAYSFLDSPSTTSSTTYKIQFITWSSTTFHLNRPNSIGNARYTMGGASTITAMEIGS